MGAQRLFAFSKSAPPRTIDEARRGGEARPRLRRDVATRAQPALTTLGRSVDGCRPRVSRCVSALRRECSFERDAIDDATPPMLGDFQRLVATASQGRVTPSLNQYINSIDIQDCIPPFGDRRAFSRAVAAGNHMPRQHGSALLASVRAETHLPVFDFSRFADGDDRATFPSDQRTAEPECGGPVGGAAASPICRTAADQFRRADASQSATRNAARAVHQLERERMSR